MLEASGFLHEHVAEVTAQLWHASSEENKFWLKASYGKGESQAATILLDGDKSAA
jgi:hypothetical protein